MLYREFVSIISYCVCGPHLLPESRAGHFLWIQALDSAGTGFCLRSMADQQVGEIGNRRELKIIPDFYLALRWKLRRLTEVPLE